MTLTRPVAWRSTDLCGSHPRPVGIYTDSRCTRARARRSLKHLLAFTFNALHGQVVLAIYFVQLCRIYLGGVEPETEASLEAVGFWQGQRRQICLDGEVIAHDVALDSSAYPADETRWTVGVRRDHREANLPAATGSKVGVQRDARLETVVQGIPEVQQYLVVPECHGLECNALVSGPERPLAGIEHDTHVVISRRGHAERELDGIRFLARLVVFRADGDQQREVFVANASTAGLHVEVQGQDLAPLFRIRQGTLQAAHRIVDHRVDIPLRRLALHRGFEMHGPLKRALLELRAQGRVRFAQGVRRGRVCHCLGDRADLRDRVGD